MVTQTNKAAERLHAYLHSEGLIDNRERDEDWHRRVCEGGEQAVRRATVERIRAALKRYGYDSLWADMAQILDEEAAR